MKQEIETINPTLSDMDLAAQILMNGIGNRTADCIHGYTPTLLYDVLEQYRRKYRIYKEDFIDKLAKEVEKL